MKLPQHARSVSLPGWPWRPLAGPAPALDAKEKKIQLIRLRMTAISLLNWLVPALALLLYASAGAVSWTIAWTFALAGMGTTSVFALLIVRGINQRFKDKDCLVAQLVVACAIELIYLALAPKMWLVFLISILGAYNFAVIRFDPRQFRIAWLLFGLTTAAALAIGRDEFGYPGTSDLEIGILWLFFFLAMQRFTSIAAPFSHLRAQLSEKNRLLSESLEKIKDLALRDELTGADNRRFFMQALTEEKERAAQAEAAFCVAILDLDHFKRVNDRFGHLIGDAVLKQFSQTVREAMRSTDRFARYGGEEFVLLFPMPTSEDTAAMAVDRIRERVAGRDWNALAPGLRVTFSAGIVRAQPQESLEHLLGRADQCLYEAKRAGRNRTVCSPVMA